MSWQILEGNCPDVLRELDAGSIQTCVTSPPYWGLRDYGAEGQLGLEPTPEQYVENLVAVFREVRRVLRDDGTVWLNLGDSYASGDRGRYDGDDKLAERGGSHRAPQPPGLKPKDLVGIPWRVAFALQADGWWLRSDVIWAKPNPMPESVTDRPTRSHEYIFLLTKSARYHYDSEAIREELKPESAARYAYGFNGYGTEDKKHVRYEPGQVAVEQSGGRNRRSVWTVTTQPFPGAHFATFPPKLIEPCVLAGSPPKCCGECGAAWERVTERTPMVVKPSARVLTRDQDEARTATSTMVEAPTSVTTGWEPTCDHTDDSGSSTVLDPFAGAGTTGVVALRHNRNFVGIELNPEYAEMARNRIRDDAPLLNTGLEIAAVTTPETRRDF